MQCNGEEKEQNSRRESFSAKAKNALEEGEREHILFLID